MERVRHVLRLDRLPPLARKIVVGFIGGIIFVAGIVMIVTPGPAFVLIPVGLLLLASEFKWAERWAQKGQDAVHRLREKGRKWKRRRAAVAK